MIIGGHSHTVLDKPAKVNNILIAQAGVGTNQIGRFDITVDDDTNSIIDYKWQLIPINSDLVKPDKTLLAYINSYKTIIDLKYNALVTKLAKKLTHPQREIETTLGNLFADVFADISQTDVMLVGSGSIRVKQLGPMVSLGDLLACFPYDDSLRRFSITGKQLKKTFVHIMRSQNRDGEGECYQVNKGIKAIYNDKTKKLESMTINGEEIIDEKLYRICVQGYHYNNCQPYLNISPKDIIDTKVITTSAQSIFEEYLRNHQNLDSKLEGRLVYKK